MPTVISPTHQQTLEALYQERKLLESARTNLAAPGAISSKHQDRALHNGLRVAILRLAQDWPSISPQDIKQRLLRDGFQLQNLKLILSKAEDEPVTLFVKPGVTAELTRVEALTFEATHTVNPINSPKIVGGICGVRLYQFPNSLGVVLYTDQGDYLGAPANILEFAEKKIDQQIEQAKHPSLELETDLRPQRDKSPSPQPELEPAEKDQLNPTLKPRPPFE